jgi:hypothetical protein
VRREALGVHISLVDQELLGVVYLLMVSELKV